LRVEQKISAEVTQVASPAAPAQGIAAARRILQFLSVVLVLILKLA
jgi:hypothetical protein